MCIPIVLYVLYKSGQKNMNDGKKFEQDVADTYTLLGYKVDADVQIAGKQVDMILTIVPPGYNDELKFYVECKDYNSAKLSSTDIRKFIYDYSGVKDKLRSDNVNLAGGMLITRNPLHSKLKESLIHNELKTYTLSELKEQALSINLMLREYITNYAESEVSKTYIPVKYIAKDGSKKLLDFVFEWLKSEQKLLVLLGDFGTGKSTFLKNLKYQLAQNYILNNKDFAPLYMELKNFEATQHSEDFYENQINKELKKNIRFDEFIKFSEKNNFFLLLDGFDEMGSDISSETRKSHFSELIKIISKSQKSILTCRPSYFISKQEMKNVLDQITYPINLDKKEINRKLRESYSQFSNSAFAAITGDKSSSVKEYYKTLHLAEFSAVDIDEYLVKFFQDFDIEYVNKIRERIRNTYDLEDLAKRPILLYLICKTLPELSDDEEATPSLIYKVYTNVWMTREERKGDFRKLITIEKKFDFVSQLAWKMYDEGVLEISYNKLPAIVKDYFQYNGRTHSIFVTHIQTCAFLNRDKSDVFRFEHKSFMEYFAAIFIMGRIFNRNDFSLLESKTISKEVSFFLGDICYSEPEKLKIIEQKFLNSVKGSSASSDNLKSNLLSIYSKSRKAIPKCKIYGLKFLNLNFLKNTFESDMENCVLEDVEFSNCRFKNIKLNSLGSSSTIFKNKSSIAGTNFIFTKSENNLKIDRSTIKSSTFHGQVSLEISKSNLTSVKFDRQANCYLSNSESSGCTYDISNEKIQIKDSFSKDDRFINREITTIGAKPRDKTLSNFRGNKFKNCTFILADFNRFDIFDCDFYNCYFIGCSFPFYSGKIYTKEMKFTKCKFIFSNISISSWQAAEENRLNVKVNEYEEELEGLRILKNKEKEAGEHTKLYEEFILQRPKMPPKPKNSSLNLFKLLDSYISKNKPLNKAMRLDIFSLPYKDNINEDNEWTSFGDNLFGVFLDYIE